MLIWGGMIRTEEVSPIEALALLAQLEPGLADGLTALVRDALVVHDLLDDVTSVACPLLSGPAAVTLQVAAPGDGRLYLFESRSFAPPIFLGICPDRDDALDEEIAYFRGRHEPPLVA
jgi:hypothetical protein